MSHQEYLHELDAHGMLLSQLSYYLPFAERYELSFLQDCYGTLVEKWPILQGCVDLRARPPSPLRRRPRSVQLDQDRSPTRLKGSDVDDDCRGLTIGDIVGGSITAGWRLIKETFRYFFEERIYGRVHVPEQLVRKWQDDCSAQGIRVTTHDTLTAWIARIVLSTSPGPKWRPFNIGIPIRVSALLDDTAHENVLENSFILSSLTLNPEDGNLSIASIAKQIRTMIDASRQIDNLQFAIDNQARYRFSLTYPLAKELGSPDPWLLLSSWNAIAPDEVAAAAFTAPGKTRFISCDELKVFPMCDLTVPNLKNTLCSFKCPCGGYWLHGPLLTQAWDAAHAAVAAEISGISNADAGSYLVDTQC
ncbi:uncharacterized protein BO95DRAFT_431126 [Aspergillus brunneoviolaceus CBS 621.78]|uniref:Uncharacterized protein n=1 Tax=Aspergillus brunneoviolaceus CBS 621.78 TaxID=1450534 RepID=A0ACD1GBL9_9EURO|nr:hypothetical protein BO95DRAFT_431126 [Aspergillus brunneoviolaceus CBS 621.78]RAH46516.1 hypothetical protein BO95DRAFT_431126 [Aspergillus brunneoviolaceus CBS 621.78]